MPFAGTSDGIARKAPLPCAARFDVLGVALAVSTNAPALLDAASEAFGPPVAAGGAGPEHAAELRLVVRASIHPARAEAPEPRVWAQGDCLRIVAGESRVVAERARGLATADIAPDLLAHPRLLERCFVECPGVFLASRHRPASLHAAALVHRGRCVLLTGAAGAGKSTLAYAALRAGMGLLAEDVTFVAEARDPQSAIRNPQWLAFGVPWRLHLLPDAPRLFPELAELAPERQLNGERKLIVRVRSARPDAAVAAAPIAGVVSLSRGGVASSRLCAADPAEVCRSLTTFQGSPPLDRAAIQHAAGQLARRRTARLEVGGGRVGIDAAVTLLRDWIDAAPE